REVLSSVATRVDVSANPLLKEHETERKVLVIPITADRGLCGAFNSNITRATMNFIREKQFESVELLPLGRKAYDFFKRRPIPIRRHATHVYQALSLATAQEIGKDFIAGFISGEIDA